MNTQILFDLILKIFFIILPLLLFVALLTYLERKTIAAMQLRRGPNVVGPLGLLQPLADGLKLLLKEIIIPTGSNKIVFLLYSDLIKSLDIYFILTCFIRLMIF